jgi:Leucine-rich repeat (LRR) protein
MRYCSADDDDSWTQIEKISDGLGECLNLKRLYLGENLLSRLPATLGNLTRLVVLDLR